MFLILFVVVSFHFTTATGKYTSKGINMKSNKKPSIYVHTYIYIYIYMVLKNVYSF